MDNITLGLLIERRACREAVDAFEKRFGQVASVKAVVDALHEIGRPDWEAWLLAQEFSLTISMLEQGADIHAQGDLALRWAAMCGRLEIVKYLIERGADIHYLALCWAKESGHTRVANFLREAATRS